MRRLLWVTVGAGVGISGYRRATRVLREFSRPQRVLRPPWRAYGVAGFARDVRDGMDQYAEQQRLNIERRRATAGPTLGIHQVTESPASRNGSAAPR